MIRGKKKPISFASELMGMDLLPYQEEFIEEIADKIHRGEPIKLVIARSPGKTTMVTKILQKLAAKYVDDGDPVQAGIVLREAEKLNRGSQILRF